MAIKLPKPPISADGIEWQQWVMTLWEYVSGNVVTSGDVAIALGVGETYHGVTTLTAGRTLTLPDANSMKDGDRIIIQDETGGASGNNITVATAGTDTINGAASVVITTDYGRIVVVKRGDGTFFSA